MSDNKGILYTIFLKKWHPVPTVMSTVLLFGLFGLAFLIFGIVVTVINGQIQEVTIPKYDQNDCKGYNSLCTFEFELQVNMDPPIYFYYELENFYQNHRRYVKSKSSTQLSGGTISSSDAEKYCDPITSNSDLFEWQQQIMFQSHRQENYIDLYSEQKTRKKGDPDYPLLNSQEVASPCGLIAKSFFNDSFALSQGGSQIPIDETGISWPNDQGKKFKSAAKSSQTQWIDPENEHFIVWMRTAGLSNFRKLWGRIEEKLEAGTYKFAVQNNYNPQTFAGAKNIVLSTSGPFGGKNYFLSVAFIVVGVICILIAAAFLIKKKIAGDAFGEKKEN